MKIYRLLLGFLLLGGISLGQTHTFPALDTDNSFTGNNSFTKAVTLTNPSPFTSQNLCILLCNNAQYVGATGMNHDQWFINLNFHNTSLLGSGNGVMSGIVIQTDSDSIDSATGISIANNGKSDGIYMGLNGKSGATASSPSGYAIDINRGTGGAENSSAMSGVGLNMFEFSSTNQGPNGPKGIYYQKVNNLNSDHIPVHLRTNNQGLLIETPEGASYDSTKNVLVIQNDVPLQKWAVTANGDNLLANGRQIRFAMNSGQSGFIGAQAGQNTMDINMGSAGIRFLNNGSFVGIMQSNGLVMQSGTLVLSPSYYTTNLLISATAPTIAAAGCGGAAASIPNQNGTAAFTVNVGTTPTSACTITMPTATTGWACSAVDVTTNSTSVFLQKQFPAASQSTTQIVLTNFSDVAVATAFTASDVLRVSCHAY